MNGGQCRDSFLEITVKMMTFRALRRFRKNPNVNPTLLFNHGHIKKFMNPFVLNHVFLLHNLPLLIARQGSRCGRRMWHSLIKVLGITPSCNKSHDGEARWCAA